MGPLQLIGPSYNLDSRPASVQRTVNMMPVPLEPGNERTAWVLQDVPGLSILEEPPLVYPTDGLLSHFEIDLGSAILSAIGPNLDKNGNALVESPHRFGDSAGEAQEIAGPFFTASGITGSLERNWRVETFMYPTINSGQIFNLSSSDSVYELNVSTAIGTGAFITNYVAEGSSGGGVLGASVVLLNQWNHLGVEYEAGTAFLHFFVNGDRVASLGPFAGNPFPDSMFDELQVGGGGYFDEFWFSFDQPLYGETYLVPSAAFPYPDQP